MQKTWHQRKSIRDLRLAGMIFALAFASAFAIVAVPSAEAQTFATVHEFDDSDGSNSYAGLVQGTDGNLYGTTSEGGANDNSSCTGDAAGCGTVFKITPSGTLTTLYSFCSQANCIDGAEPIAGLIQASNGNFYGTTFTGGANACLYGGCGTVFEITPGGKFATLHSFCSLPACADGGIPEAGLIQGTDGNLYGTTSGLQGTPGTIFKMSLSGKLTTIYTFDGTNGIQPTGTLIQASNGNFYGTTYGGDPYGTIFKMTPAGVVSTLYSFSLTDGLSPYAGLIQAANGLLYGTTVQGGAGTACSFGCGTVFAINATTGSLTTLHSFNSTDGYGPFGGLVQGTDGNFYGTTSGGGTADNGTVFKISAGGTFATLHSFEHSDGDEPYSSLLQSTNGSFYGTTEFGGAHNGTIFSLGVGLGPFVTTQPASGKVGAAVKILGSNLTGATSVTFNGVAATFTLASKTEITTTVPAGAITGTVEVTIPKGTLKSNTKFRVAP